MPTESPVNGVSTTLYAEIGSSDVSCILTDASEFPDAQYHVLLDDGINREIALGTSVVGSTLYLTRAVESYNGIQSSFAFAAGVTEVTIVPSVGSIAAMIQQSLSSGLPSWFMSGAGAPLGSIVPNQYPCLYFDTTPTTGTGLWVAVGATSEDWLGFGAIADASGLIINESNVFLISPDGTAVIGVSNGLPIFLCQNNNVSNLYIYPGDPNGNVSALDTGNVCFDTLTPAIWQASASGDSSWVQLGSGGTGLPTWFQYGSGDPIANAVTPIGINPLYYDTNGSGLWYYNESAGGVSEWMPLGGDIGGISGNPYAGYSVVGSGPHQYITSIWSNQEVHIGRGVWGSILGLVFGSSSIEAENVFFPVQAPTGSAPAWVLGGMYFDTTLNKLRIGGASGWETVTSV